MKKLMILFIFASLLLVSCSSNNHQNNQNPTNSDAKKDVQAASPETKNIKPIAEIKDKVTSNTKIDNKTNSTPIGESNKVKPETKDTNAATEAKVKSSSNIKSDNKTNIAPIEEINNAQSQYQRYSKFLNIKDKVAKFIKDDIDLDGSQEIIIAFGEVDYDIQAYVLREKNGKLQNLGQLEGFGYGVVDVELAKIKGDNQKYIEINLSNGAGLSGFALCKVMKDSIDQVAYSASPTGSGDDYLTSSTKNGICDGYMQNRGSYDVMYFSVSRYYKWNGQTFDFVSSNVDTGSYPDKPEDVVNQFLKLNMLWEEDAKSNNVINRLNEINISKKILIKEKLRENDDWKIDLQTDSIDFNVQEKDSSAIVLVPVKDEEISFNLTKINSKWQINDMNGNMTIEKK